MPKRYRNQHSRRRRRGRIKPGSWAGSRAGRRSFLRSKWAKVGQGVSLPSCPPALLRPYTQTRSPCTSSCMIVQGAGQAVLSRFDTENACQGIILDRLEYSCVCNDYIYMCAPTFIHGSAGVLIVYRKIFVYISSPDISSVDTSSGEVYFHPSSFIHLSALSRSMVATGSPFHSA